MTGPGRAAPHAPARALPPGTVVFLPGVTMATFDLDTTGLRCPQPILRIAAKAPEMQRGDVLRVTADCTTFESDVRKWCGRMRRTLLAITTEGAVQTAQIQF